MTIIVSIAGLTVQQPKATTQQPTTPRPSATTDQDLQNAARDLRNEIRNNIEGEVNAARARSAAKAQQAGPTPPTPPSEPGSFTIRGRNGPQTFTIQPHAFDNAIPQQAVDISIAFFLTMAAIIIGLPLARAFARRMDRRGGTAQVSNEVASQLAHLNQAVDAIALEVERISEGQRFTTRLLSEQRDAARQTLPSGTPR